jgi:hypothetical protein
MDRICAKCGKGLQADQGFCDECGTAWPASGDPASTPAAAHGSNKLSFVLLAVIVALVALGGGGWLLARSRNVHDAPSAALALPAAKSPPATPAPASQTAPAATQPAVPDTSSAVAALDTNGDASAAASKPCSLVSQADMEQILGMKVVKITATETGCSYFTDATMSVDIDSTWTGGKEAMSAAKGYNANPGLFEPVAGIGDEAYMQAAGVLHVLKGDVYLAINARQYPNEAQTESAMALRAMEKLK